VSGKAPGLKGNPASKRMSNPRLKEKRARSWARGQERKAARALLLAERERANKVRRGHGEPTPWELAKAQRLARRAADRREVA
jgi:hypothetical protein